MEIRRAVKSNSKKLCFFLALPIFLVVFFIFSFANAEVIINEVMTENKDSSKNEFIELYNTGHEPVTLNGYKLTKKTASGNESNLVSSSKFLGTITPKGYFLIAHPDYVEKISASLAYSGASYSIASNNSILLYDNSGKIIDLVGYGEATTFETSATQNPEEGGSTGRLNEKDTGDNSKDFTSQNPTPGSENKKIEEEDSAPKVYSDKIQITELLPNPDSADTEYIELYNNSDEKIALENWSLHDASKSGEYIFSSKDEIEAREYSAIYKETFKFALNNGGNEKITLYDPDKKSVFEVEYNGSKKGLSYNFNGTDWHWSQFLTPDRENIFEKIPLGKLKIDKTIYKDVYATFEITGLSKKAKVKWDFGDEHGSSLAKTRHKYLETGTYDASVKYSEGSEDVIKNFKIVVKKIKHPKVDIIAVNANPFGSDTDNETLTLKNKSKNKIDLLGWSIATGWEKLTNHPITESFEIKKNQEREITREFSKFTLNNKKSEIELRYPDGEVANNLKYNKKKSSIAEGEIYQKAKGKKWEWILQKNNKKPVTQSSAENISLVETEEPKEIDTAIEAYVQEKASQPEENLDNLVGKFSPRKNLKQDIESKILGFRDSKSSSGFTRKFASLNQSFVLGISTSKATRLAIKEDTFLNKYLHKINQYLNQFILKLQR